jgi:hypothetical protein
MPTPAPARATTISSVARSVLASRRDRGDSAAPAWTPANLFANSEPGVWFDPSDLTTLFQDLIGTIPVTATGQPVGLMLDKSRGLVPGAQLFAGFPVGIGTWVDNGNGSWSINGTQGTAQDLNGDNSITVPTSTMLEWTFTVSGLGQGQAVTIFPNHASPTSFGNGTHRLFRARNSNLVRIRANTGVTATVSNISAREIPGVHVNLGAGAQAARPTYQSAAGHHWLQFDGVDDTLLGTNTIPFAGGAVTAHLAHERTGGTQWIPHWLIGSTDRFWAGAQMDSALFPHGDSSSVGTPVYRVNAASMSPNTRAEMFNRLSANRNIITTTGLVLTTDTLRLAGYSSFHMNGRIYGLVLRGAAPNSATITNTEQWLASKAGVTLT